MSPVPEYAESENPSGMSAGSVMAQLPVVSMLNERVPLSARTLGFCGSTTRAVGWIRFTAIGLTPVAEKVIVPVFGTPESFAAFARTITDS